MTAQQKVTLKWLGGLLAALLPALGWGWSAVDLRYVHQVDYDKHVLADSIRGELTQTKLDELILRVQQIQCGTRISNGCR